MWIDQRVVEHCHKPLISLSWIPDSVCVVLGNSNHFEKECKVENCLADSISVLKRSGGGGAVVLHPGCVILSVGMWVKNYYRNAEYFKIINDTVIECLKEADEKFDNLSQNGISDITLNGRKIAGTSLFRSRNYLLYQASILVDSKLHLIERYLGHPTQEPEYRKGKSHKDFLSSLNEVVPTISCEDIKNIFENNLELKLRKLLEDDFVEVPEKQLIYLRDRFQTDTKVESYSKES